LEPAVREAIIAAMQRIERFHKLAEVELQSELEWQLLRVRISSKNRILWRMFEIGRLLFEQIGNSQNWKCHYCKLELDIVEPYIKKANQPTFEHLIPLGKGGADHPDNLVVACFRCNQSRGNLGAENLL
jgi:5-methylcytosine-specific restriction endonuclease McrA